MPQTYEIDATLNEEQRQAVMTTEGYVLILAGAGTGKTHTLEHRVAHLIDMGVPQESILLLTFTKRAAKEMRDRAAKLLGEECNIEARTYHSFCYKELNEYRRELGIPDDYSMLLPAQDEKVIKAVRNNLNMKDLEFTNKRIQSLFSAVANHQKDIHAILHDYDEFEDLTLWEEELTKIHDAYIEYKQKHHLLNYDDVLEEFDKRLKEHPDVAKKIESKYSYIMIDEYQDSNRLQDSIIFQIRKENHNLAVVGDDLQCQPAGTKVMMADRTLKNIEDIKVGDRVLTYNARDAHFVQQLNRYSKPEANDRNTKAVTAVSIHQADNLVEVISDNHSSRYTKDHITYAKIHYEGNENACVVYLMHHPNGWWRVGETRLFVQSQDNRFGASMRMFDEGGDQVWILDIVDSPVDVWLEEQTIAYKYGIPQVCWVTKNVKYNEHNLNELYSRIDNIDAKAERCLHDFGRDINYPMFRQNEKNKHFSKLHFFPIQVGNLIPRFMDIVIPTKNANNSKMHNEYEQIKSIQEIPGTHTVYGLDVEMHHNYVADGILTHNCLYGFRGAEIQNILTFPDRAKPCTVIKLVRNYRSNQEILNSSNSVVETAVEGFKKFLIGTHHVEYKPKVVWTKDQKQQATEVLSLIQQSIRKGYSYKDICILQRSSVQSGAIEILLEANSIPYEKRGGAKFLDRPHVQDLLAMMCVLQKPHEFVYWLQILDILEGVGEITAENMAIECVKHGFDGLLSEDAKASKTARTSLHNLYNSFGAMAVAPFPESLNIAAKCYIDEARRAVDNATTEKRKQEAKTRLQHIIDDLGVLKGMASSYGSLADFLEDVVFDQDTQKDENADQLVISTIHSAKGLEFPVVIVLNCVDGVFPRVREDEHGSAKDEEERRCFYVALTRAKNELYLVNTRSKTTRYGKEIQYHLSHFVDEKTLETVYCEGVAPQSEEDTVALWEEP